MIFLLELNGRCHNVTCLPVLGNASQDART